MEIYSKGSCVLKGVKISLNSLKERDTKLGSTDPEFNCNILLPKNSKDVKELIVHIKKILAEKNLKVEQLKPEKFPIKDGDKIYESLENKENDRGIHLKGMYQIKFGTKFDYKCLDAYGEVLDHTKVGWMGAEVDIQFQPLFYTNNFGKGIKLALLAIRVISQNNFESDPVEEVFDFAKPENTFEDIGEKPGPLTTEDDDELPF